MHEIGLCEAIRKKIDSMLAEEGLTGINRITIEVGSLSGVIPRYLVECWSAVTDGTKFEGSEMCVETAAGTARCLSCGAEFEADPDHLLCPSCGSSFLTPLTGREMLIREIEAY